MRFCFIIQVHSVWAGGAPYYSLITCEAGEDSWHTLLSASSLKTSVSPLPLSGSTSWVIKAFRAHPLPETLQASDKSWLETKYGKASAFAHVIIIKKVLDHLTWWGTIWGDTELTLTAYMWCPTYRYHSLVDRVVQWDIKRRDRHVYCGSMTSPFCWFASGSVP